MMALTRSATRDELHHSMGRDLGPRPFGFRARERDPGAGRACAGRRTVVVWTASTISVRSGRAETVTRA